MRSITIYNSKRCINDSNSFRVLFNIVNSPFKNFAFFLHPAPPISILAAIFYTIVPCEISANRSVLNFHHVTSLPIT